MNHFLSRHAGRPRIAVGHANQDQPGGDCARVFRRPNGEVLCFLGDVSGHDEQATRLAWQLGSFVSARAAMTPGPMLSLLNAELHATWSDHLFVSAICLSFDARTGRGRMAVAGQLPPIIKTPWDASVLDVTAGPPLGVLTHERYREWDFGLSAGELLVAVTDGVTDPLASHRDLLGMAALARLVSHAPADPHEVCASLLRAVEPLARRDDATVLAIGAAGNWAPAHPVEVFSRSTFNAMEPA